MALVISNAVRNLVTQHPEPHLSYSYRNRNRVPYERGNIGVEDEILRCAQNDKGHLWVLLFSIVFLLIFFLVSLGTGDKNHPGATLTKVA